MAGFGIINSDWLTLPWESARNFLKDELESLRLVISNKWGAAFNPDNTLAALAIGGDPTKGRRYVANTGKHFSPFWTKAVYQVNTDNYFIKGGPIEDSGTIAATDLTSAAIESARHTLFGGASL